MEELAPGGGMEVNVVVGMMNNFLAIDLNRAWQTPALQVLKARVDMKAIV